MDEETKKKNDIENLISSAKDLKISGVRTFNNDLQNGHLDIESVAKIVDNSDTQTYQKINSPQETSDEEIVENEVDIDSAEIIKKNNYLEPVDPIYDSMSKPDSSLDGKISKPVTKIIQEENKIINPAKENTEIRSKTLSPDENLLISPVRTFNNNFGEKFVKNPLSIKNDPKEPPLQVPESGAKTQVLRTFDDDIKNAMQKDNISTAKIFMAEQQKRDREEEEENSYKETKKSNILKTFWGLLFIILGIGIIGYSTFYYIKKNKDESKNINQSITKSFIEIDSTVAVNTSFKALKKTLGEVRDNMDYIIQIKNDDIAKIRLEKTVGVEEGEEIVKKDIEINTSEFFSLIKSEAPSKLIRSLNSEMILGVHNNRGSREPFIIFRVADFDQAYANMFAWEKTIVNDLQDIFYKKLGSSKLFAEELVLEISNNSSSTASTSTETSSTTATSTKDNVSTTTKKATTSTSTISTTTTNPAVIKEEEIEDIKEEEVSKTYNSTNFVDLILSNKDTRAILNNKNDLLFFYSFTDKENLIITTNQQTLTILMNRIANSRLIK